MNQGSAHHLQDTQIEDITHQTRKMNLNFQPSSTEPTGIFKLPPETLLAVFERCETRNLPYFFRFSKVWYRIVVPMLYRKVDRSSDALTCSLPTVARYTFVYYNEASDSVKCTNLPRNIRNKQQAIVRTILAKPKLAPLVRSFFWTLFDSQPGNSQFQINNPSQPIPSQNPGQSSHPSTTSQPST